jgi:UDP-3-O-[3-hydroxymyristoyl] glucosamine N-acyltransferase
MKVEFSLEELVSLTRASSVTGSASGPATGIASLKQAGPGDLSFLTHRRYQPELEASKAGFVFVPEGFEYAGKPGQVVLRVASPNDAITSLCRKLETLLWPRPAPGVHPTAFVDPRAEIHPDATIGAKCVVEAGATVGSRTVLEAGVVFGRNSSVGPDSWLGYNVTVYPECSIGARVRLHSGVVVGADGYGYEFSQGRHAKVPQVGTVVIEDDVEIGANSCIDRARFGATVVGQGTKVDNLVQIAHNCRVGKHCILVAQVAIAGSTTLGDYVMVGGQAGLAGHIEIGAGSKIAGQSGVAHDLPPKSYVMGSPAIEALKDQKFQMMRQRVPELLRRIEALERRLPESGH